MGAWDTRQVTSPRLVVGAVLVDSLETPTRFVGTRRTKPAELVGRWEFPGGKVEPGERPEAALVRELREELSIDVQLGAELPGPGGRPWPISATYEMRVWFATVVAGAIEPTDSHDEYRWLTTADAMSVPWLDADVPIAGEIGRRLR